jgi:hypothetical protein
MDLPDDETLRFIVSTYARLRAAHGESIGEPTLLQPTAQFFPDEFRSDAPSVASLLRRMIGYAPLAGDLTVEVALLAPDEPHGGGCGSIACGSGGGAGSIALDAEEIEAGYRVSVPVTHLGNADVLTASLARSVGALVLHEAGEPAESKTSEIAAVTCGFGVLLVNGAAVWAKSCGGLRMARATVLAVDELAVVLAIFVAVHRRKASEARKHLGATQREAFDLAHDWVESNPTLVDMLRARPAMLEAGLFDMEPLRGALGRWLHKRGLERQARSQAAPSRPAMTDERRRRLEEARALVDEALGEADA